jgi:RNA polymerase sigma factor (TIGR02999 family)
MAESAPDVTQMLLAWRGGNHEALRQLLPLVYGELRRLARHHLRRGKREDTFESKALVHEAYLRLVDQDRVEWRDRTHFFGLASNLMRCILVDHYRTKHAVLSQIDRDGWSAALASDPLATQRSRVSVR